MLACFGMVTAAVCVDWLLSSFGTKRADDDADVGGKRACVPYSFGLSAVCLEGQAGKIVFLRVPRA